MGSGGRRCPSEYTSIICEVFYDSSRKKTELDQQQINFSLAI